MRALGAVDGTGELSFEDLNVDFEFPKVWSCSEWHLNCSMEHDVAFVKRGSVAEDLG